MIEQIKAIADQGGTAVALQHMVVVFQEDVVTDLVLSTACDLLERVHKEQSAAWAELPAEQKAEIPEPTDEELQLFQYLRENSNSPQAYYDIATRFFRMGQVIVARPFYSRAKEMLDKDMSELSQNVSVELSQVLMELSGYQESATILQELNDTYGGLPIELILKMAECHVLLRAVPEAEALLSIVTEEALADNPPLEQWYEETGDLLARVQDVDDREQLGLREWHYVQSRGMIVAVNPDPNMPGERFALCAPPLKDIAQIIGVTAAVLDQRGYAPNRLLWLGDRSEPLARLFAEWWDVAEEDVRPYQPGDNNDDEENLALLVMAHSNDILALPDEEAVFELYEAQAGLIMFALNLFWTERQPITPDISGLLSQICYLPWEANVAMDNQGSVNITPLETMPDARALAKQMAALLPSEEECDQSAQRVLEAYAGCTDLIIDHRDGELFRKSLVTHSPVPSPQISFN
jgi:tetratricopeptide (TPR) repeat protein